MAGQVEGKVALVTGGSSGIGAAVAGLLAGGPRGPRPGSRAGRVVSGIRCIELRDRDRTRH